MEKIKQLLDVLAIILGSLGVCFVWICLQIGPWILLAYIVKKIFIG